MDSPKLKLADSSLCTITSPVRRCYLGKLYFAAKGRSSGYGPTLRFTRDEIGSLFLTIREIERFIEPRRKKGTFWEIYDIPCVVIESNASLRLVITGGGLDIDPLKDFRPVLPPGCKFGELCKSLMSQLPKYVYALHTIHYIPLASFPFTHKRSRSAESKRVMRDIGEGPIPTKKLQWDASFNLLT